MYKVSIQIIITNKMGKNNYEELAVGSKSR